jgi:hypothetical protein
MSDVDVDEVDDINDETPADVEACVNDDDSSAADDDDGDDAETEPSVSAAVAVRGDSIIDVAAPRSISSASRSAASLIAAISTTAAAAASSAFTIDDSSCDDDDDAAISADADDRDEEEATIRGRATDRDDVFRAAAAAAAAASAAMVAGVWIVNPANRSRCVVNCAAAVAGRGPGPISLNGPSASSLLVAGLAAAAFFVLFFLPLPLLLFFLLFAFTCARGLRDGVGDGDGATMGSIESLYGSSVASLALPRLLLMLAKCELVVLILVVVGEALFTGTAADVDDIETLTFGRPFFVPHFCVIAASVEAESASAAGCTRSSGNGVLI